MNPESLPISIILALNQPLREVFLKVLEEEKDFWVFEEIQSLKQTEDILSEERIDIVIAEVRNLQDLHGLRKFIQKSKTLKAIVMGDNKDITLECMKAGAKGYLSYNIPPDLLKKAIKVIHKGQIWIDQKTTSEAFEEFARLAQEKRQFELIETLSDREREIIRLVAQGYKNKDIAQTLFISVSTVKTHLYHIFEKIGVQDRINAALLVSKRKSL